MTTEPAGPARGPLSGIRVLDLTQVVMGPYATQLLADQGADVLMVERPGGDTNRVMGDGPHPELSGVSLNVLRNKRSVRVDLREPGGVELVRRLVPHCDVVVTAMRPQAITGAGLTYAELAPLREGLVYCQAQGWPLDSARANEPAYDDIIQAEAGAADIMGLVTGVPALIPTVFADKVCGLVIAQAVTAALLHRERTGEGQHIEVPMNQATASFLLVEHGSGAISEPPVAEAGYRRVLTRERRPHQTMDGWVHMLPYEPKHYAALFEAAGRTDLLDDPRYVDRRATLRNSDSLYRDVREVAAGYRTDELIEFCTRRGIPVTRVGTIAELVDSLPLAEHPVTGPYRVIPHPARFSRTPASVRSPAPLIGQHTEEVITELLGDA